MAALYETFFGLEPDAVRPALALGRNRVETVDSMAEPQYLSLAAG